MMAAVPAPSEPSRETLLTEVLALRQRLAELEQENQDLHVRLVKLAPRTAELHLDQPVPAFSNLKLHLWRPSGEMVSGELFAKVVETCPADACGVVVCFTSIPEAARTFLDTLRRYEYHVINRAEQV